MQEKIIENFFKDFQKCEKPKHFKRLLISIPKFTELNSQSKPKLILVLGLGVTQGHKYNFFYKYSFFWG